jgi:hypothetical protein
MRLKPAAGTLGVKSRVPRLFAFDRVTDLA